MSITTITITQDNIIGTNNKLSVHSPLIFLAEAETSSTFPDTIDVEVRLDSVLVGTFNATPYKNEGSKRIYMFEASNVLKSFMQPFDDINQAVEDVDLIPYASSLFNIKFIEGAVSDDVDIVAICSANQRGDTETAKQFQEYTIYAFYLKLFYMHIYNDNVTSTTLEFGTTGSLTTSTPGVYRHYLDKTADEVVETKIGGVKNYNINVKVLPSCDGGLYVKFLDNATGFYKHWLFNKYYSIDGNSEKIGRVDVLATTLSETKKKDVGSRFTKRYQITADNLTQEHLDYISCIKTTPRLYVEIDGEWVLCSISDSTFPVRWRKANSGSLSLTIELPEQYTIRM